MKILIFSMLVLSGCASVSPYEQGCSDALVQVNKSQDSDAKNYCENLFKQYQAQQRVQSKRN